MDLTKTKSNTQFIVPTVLAALFLMANDIYNPYVTPFLLQQGYSKEAISFMYSLSHLALIFTVPVLGGLADVIGRKKIMNLSLLIYSASVLLYFFSNNNYFVVLSAVILSAIFYAGFLQTALEKSEDNIENHRGLFTGIFESIKSLGGLIGSLVGTFLVSFLPLTTTFKVTIFLALMIFILNSLHKSHNHNRASLKDFNFISDIKEFLAVRELWGMAILGFFSNFTGAFRWILVPILLTETLKADVKYIGLFMSILAFAHLFQFAFGYTCEKVGVGRTILRSVMIFGLLLAILGYSDSAPFVLAVSILIGIALSFWNTSAVAFMSEIGEKVHKEGAIIGSYVSISSIGNFFGYLSCGLLLPIIGLRGLFVLFGLFPIVGALLAKKYIKSNSMY